MSKDEACKVTSAGKHKERKPKKPHYIPRPWGKPYNYKCFQCPFTCMEKSHLYNHMKYSLCKNSLSLLIESDWPYKKGNILHPDQLRPLQQAHGLQAAGKEELEQVICSEEKQGQRRCEEEDGETLEEEQEGREQRPEISASAKAASNNGRGGSPATKRSKQPEPELLMADMLTLEDQLLRVRSAELEAQLRHYKIPKTCLTSPGLLPDQWRLFASSHSKGKADGAQQRVSGSIPCYPPPTSLVDQQDPGGLNLSVLGVGYPISPGWLSYMNPAGVAAQTQFAQLPFLASAAQLVPPAPGADRGLVPHRLYYPFLCEHNFGAAQSDAGKSLKTPPSSADSAALTGFQPKVGLWKVPALRPGNTAPPAGWVSPQRDSPDRGYRSGEKMQTIANEGKATCGLKRTGGPIRGPESPVEKQQAVGFTLDLLRNIQTAAADKHLLQISLQDPQLQSRPGDQWYNQTLISPSREAACLSANSQDAMEAGASESVAALLSDLSKALQEYQEAERRISHLETEDLPAQRQLWEHLSKIRSELSHIHQALERTASQSDGPLDLSVKKEATDEQTDREDGRIKATETEEDEKEDGEDESERQLVRASLEKRKQSLDMLIKMSQASVVNAEVLGLRSAETLWPSGTTKCEADSSVLLCPDGRSVRFADMPATVKPPKGPASLRRQEAQCPPSPLTPPDG